MFFGILGGLVAYMITGSLGLYLLKIGWVDYASASRDKSYTLGMLLARVFVGLLASIAAGISVTIMTNGKGRCAYYVGLIILSVAGYIHFFKVWTAYPFWYHFAYLLPIVPIITLINNNFKRESR